MANYTFKEMVGNFLSVVIGVISAFAILISLIAFLMFIGAINADAQKPVNGIENYPPLSFAIAMVISSVTAGYITAKISTRRNWLHVGLTGLSILVIYINANELLSNFNMHWDYGSAALIVPFTFLGGYIELKKGNDEI